VQVLGHPCGGRRTLVEGAPGALLEDPGQPAVAAPGEIPVEKTSHTDRMREDSQEFQPFAGISPRCCRTFT
jgi:hypothetical protein